MALRDPVSDEQRRRRLEADKNRQRLLDQRREKCRSLRILIDQTTNERGALERRRAELQQEWRDLSTERLNHARDSPRFRELADRQNRLQARIQQLGQQFRRAEDRIEALNNDRRLNQCDAIE